MCKFIIKKKRRPVSIKILVKGDIVTFSLGNHEERAYILTEIDCGDGTGEAVNLKTGEKMNPLHTANAYLLYGEMIFESNL